MSTTAQSGSLMGRFRLAQRIAEGAGGRLHRAVELVGGVERAAAVLVLGSSPARAEALAAARRGFPRPHPNLTQIVDFAEDYETPWVAFAWLEGLTLAELLTRR